MKTSTEIWSIAKLVGEEKAIEHVAKSGFDAWDFSMFEMCRYDRQNARVIQTDHPLSGRNYLSFVSKLKRIGLDNGIVCNQTHAPFPTDANEVMSFMKRAIECTAEVGGEICVIHPLKKVELEKNIDMYSELLIFAKSCNVKLAAENIYTWNVEKDIAMPAACSTAYDFCALIDAIDDESFVACLDIGHAEMMTDGTNAPAMIKALGNRIKALHICDNDKRHDSHQIPFSMSIDFDGVVSALKHIGYKGYFTLEAGSFLDGYTSENIHKAVKNLALAAQRLAKMFDEL